MDQSQLMILSGRQFRGFDQYMLYVFVALLESGVRRLCGALFFSA
jgi:hypothetical protein